MSNKAGKQAFRRHCDDCDTDFSRREHLRKHYQSQTHKDQAAYNVHAKRQRTDDFDPGAGCDMGYDFMDDAPAADDQADDDSDGTLPASDQDEDEERSEEQLQELYRRAYEQMSKNDDDEAGDPEEQEKDAPSPKSTCHFFRSFLFN